MLNRTALMPRAYLVNTTLYLTIRVPVVTRSVLHGSQPFARPFSPYMGFWWT